MTISIFPTPHRWHKCNDHDCYSCRGGLSMCTVCGGAEGSLTEHCPGVLMTNETEAAVYAGELDYRAKHGGWTSWSRDKENAVRRKLNGAEL